MALNWDYVDEILDKVIFYRDVYDRYVVYAEYSKREDCLEFYPINSKEFESCLRIWYRDVSGKRDSVPVGEILRYINDDSNFYDEFEQVLPHTRIAGNMRDGIEYYLANKQHQVVSVKNGRWRINNNPKHKFLTTSSCLEQIIPEKCEEDIIELLTPLVNLRGDDLLLFAIWLIQAFSSGTHYGLLLSAERGSGKSTLTRLIHKIIDPSKAETTLMQTNLENFQNHLANHYVCCFDNIRRIPVDHSDTLCTAITGGTVGKRQLYSDRDEVLLELHNIVVLNGIGIFPSESDLAERMLYFELKKISSDSAVSDYDLKQGFEEKRSKILGCIFDILAKATVSIKALRAKKPTRFVDAYTEMLAIALNMGVTEDRFHQMITDNISKMNRASAKTPVVEAVCEYMNGPAAGKRKVTLTSTEFFTNVKNNYSGKKSELGSRAAEFSKRISIEHDALESAGFRSIVDDTSPSASKITIIRKK